MNHFELMSNPKNFKDATSIYEFTVKDIMGEDVCLEKYRGHVCIIVNVATQCPLSSCNISGLVKLYNEHSESKGLRILAFPCDQFFRLEWRSNFEIVMYMARREVHFDVFDKTVVNGRDAHPLFKYLKWKQSGWFGESIVWNYTKFIIDKDGVPVDRCMPITCPKYMEKYLEKYW